MRILLLGANGQVGYALHRSLVGLGDIVAATRGGRLPGSALPCEAGDFETPRALEALVQRVAPDVVVNAAAWTAVDKAEAEAEVAYRINRDAVAELAEVCAARDALLVHYSTDYVFPGNSDRPWHEDDETAPLGVYGASKLAGEDAVRASGCRHMIFRTAWVYDHRGHNFLRTMLRLGAERDALRVVADQIGTPTPAAWVAQATALALARAPGSTGTWHLAADGETSWHAFAEAIFERALAVGLLARTPRVQPITTADYPTPARRPAYSRLDTSRLARDFGITLPDWRIGLDQVMAELA
ncbi:dTDP-4-dehydrorhamnose reductase [Luteimonas salinilitoris]|uniref:dTDP-4-dehydrorhamnose reductase n=1 Tax=Luteimonas salinilitoris TaxID=3237697 RepID=A0ABV4HWI7_9GAMM